MAYNISFMDTSNNILDYTKGLNVASGNQIVYWVLVLVWIITFIALKHFDTKVVFFSSSFTTSLVGIIFFAMGWIGLPILIIPLVMTMFSLIGFLFNKD